MRKTEDQKKHNYSERSIKKSNQEKIKNLSMEIFWIL